MRTFKLHDEDIEDLDDIEEEMLEDTYYERNKLEEKKNIPAYELVYASKLEEGEEPLSRVIGHENQKK